MSLDLRTSSQQSYMKLLQVEVHNYKSLRNVSFSPGDLSVLVGPNASGKSNLIDALDFIGEMYRWGLDLAVQRHGGYENICYRQQRRSKAPITISVRALLRERDVMNIPGSSRTRRRGRNQLIELEHVLSIATKMSGIQAPYHITKESLHIDILDDKREGRSPLLTMHRGDGDDITINIQGLRDMIGDISPEVRDILLSDERLERVIARFSHDDLATQLLTRAIEQVFFLPIALGKPLGSIQVFEPSPASCRENGVPTPTPTLDRSGANLPAVIQYIKAHRSGQYAALLQTLQRVMPTLDELDVATTPQKTLTLLFKERRFKKPWSSLDVSDGTIRAVALLAAVFDPSISILVVEEPENSLHPWAIRQFLDACRIASEDKQVILTTHSPILVNHVRPEEVWLVRRPSLETKVDQITAIDPEIATNWSHGEYTLAEYLDSGIIDESVPLAGAMQ